MGNYLSFYNNVDDVYTLQDEEKERTVIDKEMDTEINTKNFWYWGLLDDYILEKTLGQKILTPEEELLSQPLLNDLQNNELPQAEC
jgi:hypothetical protein